MSSSSMATATPSSRWLQPYPDAAEAALADGLKLFEPIGLAEMDPVALLDRTDTKYALNLAQLLDVLPALREHYRVLEIGGRRQSAYRTLYFDTPEFELYHLHHGGRRVRYKVRSREYVNTGLTFFEVKRKTGRSRTRKERIATAGLATQVTPDAHLFLQDYLPLPDDGLAPTLWNEYTRVTLVSRHIAERLTLDLDLRFAVDDRAVMLPGLVTVEVKQAGQPRSSAFVQLMRAHHLHSNGFSKYCVGVSLLYPALKHNRFKPTLRRIDALLQGRSRVCH